MANDIKILQLKSDIFDTRYVLRSGDTMTGGFEVTSLSAAYVEKTGTYGVGDNDFTINCTSGTFTVTLPSAVNRTGRIYNIKNSGSGTITVATTSSQTIDGLTSQSLLQFDNMCVQSTGANWIII